MDIRFTEKSTSQARIKVIGIGGGGSNVINHLYNLHFDDAEFAVINTDSQDLAKSPVSEKIQIGKTITHGRGTGGNSGLGRESAEIDRDMIKDILEDVTIAFLVSCMGGGTGTGALPVVTSICKELGILTITIVTKPFFFEGSKKDACASEGLKKIHDQSVTIFTIPNNKLIDIANEETSLIEAFKIADNFLCEIVKAVSRLINKTGLINLDFADIETIMKEKGRALIGFGEAEGTGKTLKAFEGAISSPLLEEQGILGAKGILISIVGGEDLSLLEINHAMRKIQASVHPDAHILFGASIDEDMNNRVSLTIIATGLDEKASIPAKKDPAQAQPVKEEQTFIEFNDFERGRFAKTEPTIKNGVDLDIPTYIRKKVNILEE